MSIHKVGLVSIYGASDWWGKRLSSGNCM